MEQRRNSEQYEGFLCKSLGVFENFDENGSIFDREEDMNGKNSMERVNFNSDSLDSEQNDFWGFPNETSEICDTGVKIDVWMDSLKVCDQKMEYFDFESQENEQKRNVLVRHDFGKELRSPMLFSGDTQKGDDSPRREILTDIPLSPETQKKNELCSYLQLMNMNNADKKTVSAIQNRRSNRVKNLKILTERRNLEQKQLAEFNESLEKKSFEELGLVVNDDYQITNTIEKINFNVRLLPENLLTEIKYFDDSIMKVIGSDIKKKIENECKNNNNLKENKSYKKHTLQDKKIKKQPVKEHKVISLNKRKIEKPKLTLKRNNYNTKSLRSSINLNNIGIKALSLNERKIKSLRSSVNLNNVGIKSLTLNETKIKRIVHKKKIDSRKKFVTNNKVNKIRHTESARRINVKIKMNNERIDNKKSRVDKSIIITRKQKLDIEKKRNVVQRRESRKDIARKRDIKIRTTKIDLKNRRDKLSESKENKMTSRKVEKRIIPNSDFTETRNSKYIKVHKENVINRIKQDIKNNRNETKTIKPDIKEPEVKNKDPERIEVNKNHSEEDINNFNISKPEDGPDSDLKKLSHKKMPQDLKQIEETPISKTPENIITKTVEVPTLNDINTDTNYSTLVKIDYKDTLLLKTPEKITIENSPENSKISNVEKITDIEKTVILEKPLDIQKIADPPAKSIISGQFPKTPTKSYSPNSRKLVFPVSSISPDINRTENPKTIQCEINASVQKNKPATATSLGSISIQLTKVGGNLVKVNFSKLMATKVSSDAKKLVTIEKVKTTGKPITETVNKTDKLQNVETLVNRPCEEKYKTVTAINKPNLEIIKNNKFGNKINSNDKVTNEKPDKCITLLTETKEINQNILNNKNKELTKTANIEIETVECNSVRKRRKDSCSTDLPPKQRKVSLLSSAKKNTDIHNKDFINGNKIFNKEDEDFSLSKSDIITLSSSDVSSMCYDDSLSPISKNPTEISKFVFREDKTESPSRLQTSFNVVDLSQNTCINTSNFDSHSYISWEEHNYMKNPELEIDNFNKDHILNVSSSCSELSNDDRELLKESYKEIPRINSVPPTDIFEPKIEVPIQEKSAKTPSKQKKGLHKLLMQKNRNSSDTLETTLSNENCFDNQTSTNSIKIDFTKGKILNARYLGFHLVIVQEQLISFWTQSPLGNMLGVHNLWVSKGHVQRMPLDSNYICKESQEVMVNLENKSCAYIELWMKQHKSEKRELPLADIFATVYFWTSKNAVEVNRKLLQLANIKGEIKDVQYAVLRTARKIIVSWVETQNTSLTTVVSCYVLSPDYQTVVSVLRMTSVKHYVQSLHTIGDCCDAVVGFGENNITIWELEYGEVFETIEINQKYSDPRMLWLERDRGLLFFIQYHRLERLLMLIAVNGYSKESKKMQVFRIPAGYDTLKGVCVDNNMLGAVFRNGIICWNIKTGDEIIAELSSHPYLLPSNKHIVEIKSNTIEVTHFQSYFLTNFDLQT